MTSIKTLVTPNLTRNRPGELSLFIRTFLEFVEMNVSASPYPLLRLHFSVPSKSVGARG